MFALSTVLVGAVNVLTSLRVNVPGLLSVATRVPGFVPFARIVTTVDPRPLPNRMSTPESV